MDAFFVFYFEQTLGSPPPFIIQFNSLLIGAI